LKHRHYRTTAASLAAARVLNKQKETNDKTKASSKSNDLPQ